MTDAQTEWLERYVLLYESSADRRTRIPEFFPAHSAYSDAFRRARPGVLLMIGPFPVPEDGRPGAMSIFTTREAAEEFAISDPFVVNDVVERWYVRPWLVSSKD